MFPGQTSVRAGFLSLRAAAPDLNQILLPGIHPGGPSGLRSAIIVFQSMSREEEKMRKWRIFLPLIFVLTSRLTIARWVQIKESGIVDCFEQRGTDLYAGIRDGVFLSTDNGRSWTSASAGLAGATVFAPVVPEPNLSASPMVGVFHGQLKLSWTALKGEYYGIFQTGDADNHYPLHSHCLWMFELGPQHSQ
jgi:hypothetical protein